MKKTILILVILILSASAASALEKYYEITLIVERGELSLDAKRIYVGDVSVVYDSTDYPKYQNDSGSGIYEFTLYSQSGQVLTKNNAVFSFLVSDRKEIMNRLERKVLLLYSPEAARLEVRNKGNIVLNYIMPNLCNLNKICDGNETYSSCSDDCQSYLNDGGLCTPLHDDICDTDCPSEIDPDCLAVGEVLLPSEPGAIGVLQSPFIKPAVVILLMISVLFLVFRLAVRRRQGEE